MDTDNFIINIKSEDFYKNMPKQCLTHQTMKLKDQ